MRATSVIKISLTVIAFFLFAEWYIAHTHYGLARHDPEDTFGGQPIGGTIDNWGIKENIWPNRMRVSRPKLSYDRPQRALVCGCSYTYGNGVVDQDTYVWHLNDSITSCDFDNLSFNGFGPYDCLIRMQEQMNMRRYDTVLYVSIFDHLFRNSSARKMLHDDREYRDIAVTLWAEVAPDGESLIYHPTKTVIWPGDTRSYFINFLKIASTCITHPYNNNLTLSERQKIMRLMVGDMYKIVSAKGSKFGFVCLDRDPSIMLGLTKDQVQKLPYPCLNASWFCDIMNGYQTGTPEHPGGHPNAEVHRFYAKKIGAWLKEQRLL